MARTTRTTPERRFRHEFLENETARHIVPVMHWGKRRTNRIDRRTAKRQIKQEEA